MRKGRIEVRFSGFGGQGIISAAIIAGKAVAIYEGRESVVMESYGPESRGGSSSGTVVIDDNRVDYPYVIEPDILVAMSQGGYEKYKSEIKKGGFLLIDEDLVEPEETDKAKIYRIPATRIAEELGSKIVANIVMLGFLLAVTKIVTLESMKRSILSRVPPKTADLNMKAFQRGYEFGIKALSAKG